MLVAHWLYLAAAGIAAVARRASNEDPFKGNVHLRATQEMQQDFPLKVNTEPADKSDESAEGNEQGIVEQQPETVKLVTASISDNHDLEEVTKGAVSRTGCIWV